MLDGRTRQTRQYFGEGLQYRLGRLMWVELGVRASSQEPRTALVIALGSCLQAKEAVREWFRPGILRVASGARIVQEVMDELDL
jgi:hypothetical protein